MRTCLACGTGLVVQRADARFCDATCRQRFRRAPKAVRGPLTRFKRDSVANHRPAPVVMDVTDNRQSAHTRRRKLLPPNVVPDPVWPGMYRVRLPDGSLTDMVNLTRAREAAGMLLK